MRYRIVHSTTYTYDRSVNLKPHLIRLLPRSDAAQKLDAFSCKIDPEPQGISYINDLDGNTVAQIWFNKPSDRLFIEVTSEVETYLSNPFNYLLESYALKLPIDYPTSLLSQLSPYSQKQYPQIVSPGVIELAEDIWFAADGEIVSFLSQLNQHIYQNCQYEIRVTGDPLPSGITWKQKSGSCRDFAVLFIEVCRVVGLAARFVSGYQEGDLKLGKLDLHAWAEVYLPGAGWRGYDPTIGLAVSDRHIALAASAFPSYAAPVTGNFSPPGTQFSMTSEISMQISQ